MIRAYHYTSDSRFLAVDDEVQSNFSVVQQGKLQLDVVVDTMGQGSHEETPTSIEAFVAEIYTTVAAISISCNFLLLFLISRKKYPDEESKQPVYHRIMCALAIFSSFSAGNYFIAGLTDNFALEDDSSKSYAELSKVITQSSDISLGCYIQGIIDGFSYTAFMFGCCWLCLYFLLKLKYGVARISPFAEASVYAIIFLVTLGDTGWVFVNGTVAPSPLAGICVIFPHDEIAVITFSMFVNCIFVFGILSMILIIYKTFRDEQQINNRSLSSFRQLSNQQQEHLHPAISLVSSFEATKDIAIQALAFVIFLFFVFYIQEFLAFQPGYIYRIIAGVLSVSQGIYLLALYLWFEIRNTKNQYPNTSTKAAMTAIFIHGGDMEPLVEGQESREETPLLAEKQRCLIDITLVEDDMCADVMHAFREVNNHDEEEARRQTMRKEEEKRLKLQAENMRMFGGGYDSENMRTLNQALEVSFGNLDFEIANRKLNHYNSAKDASKPVTHRYGSIDPTTFRTETTEEEVDNLSAEGTRDQSQLKIVGEGMVLEEIEEGDEEEEEESSEDDSKDQKESSLEPSTQQPPKGGSRSVVSDLTMISTLRF